MKSKTKNKLFLIIIGILLAFSSIRTQNGSYKVNYNENMDMQNKTKEPKSSYTIGWVPNGTPILLYEDEQSLPQLCFDGKEGVIITWEDYRNNYPDIYAQRVDFNGETKWTPDGVAICMADDNQYNPQICNDGTGGAIITWQDSRTIIDKDIYAQRIDSNGAIKWDDDGIPICPTDGLQTSPLICSDGMGGAIIAWNEENNDNSNISVQIIDSEGKLKWDNGLVICNAKDHQYLSHICSDGTGGAIITWLDYRNGPETDIFAQRLDSTGDTLWGSNGVAICKANKNQLEAIASNDGEGGAIFTWKDERADSGDIYAQGVYSEGLIKWMPYDGVAICTADTNQFDPQICSDEIGGAIITWTDERNGDKNWDIFAQRVNTTGDIQWTSNGTVICTEIDYQYCTDISSDGEGGAFMVWEDYRDISADIYAQHISSNEVLEWPENGTLICNANNGQIWPTMCSDDKGGAVITWQDDRDTQDYDIYAQRIKNPISISQITGGHGGGDSDDDKEIEEISLIPIIGIIGGSVTMAGIAIIILWKKQLFTKKPRDINE